MRHKPRKLTPVKSKVIVMTGGLKEDASQLELKGGDLIGCQNYQEVDGVFHGYSSISGYERFDGQTPASSILAPFIEDIGVDLGTVIDLESGSDTGGTKDYSTHNHPYVMTNIIEDVRTPKFGASDFYFTDSGSTIAIGDHVAFDAIASDFTIDFLLKLTDTNLDVDIMTKGVSWKLSMLNERLVFSYSTDGVSYTDTLLSGSLLADGKRYHIAIVQVNNVLKMFIDGSESASSGLMPLPIDTSSTADFVLGGGMTGWLDVIRISDSYKWYKDFTIPITEYSIPDYYTEVVDDIEREAQRELIQEVPGEGPVLSVGVLNGVVGAIRNAVGGASSDIFASTPTGWSAPIEGAPTIHYEAGKDNAGIGFQEGDTITGSVSGASSTILHFNQYSGIWTGGGTAQGIMLLDPAIVNPPFVEADILSNGAGVTATIATGVGQGIVPFMFQPDGVYSTAYAAFDELSGNQRKKLVYQANGVNNPTYFNGTNIVPILHVNLPDSHTTGIFATYVTEFKNRLWLAYPDGRLWYSGVGNPHEWDTATGGAGEIYLEDEITSLMVAPGDVLVVFCRNSMQIIKTIADSGVATADTVADYAFFNQTFSKRSGAIKNTVGRILGEIYFLDDRGLTSLSASDTYGDFTANSISKNVQRRLIQKKDRVVSSSLQRESNQYRLFFDDKTGFIFTFDAEKKVKGVTQLLYKHQMTCFAEGEDTDGSLLLVFGTEDGYVMRQDIGTSFDGLEIETYMTPAYYSYNTPTEWKRFMKATFEMQGDNGLILKGRPDFNYRDANMPKSVEELYNVKGQGGVYGTDAWGAFRWSEGSRQPVMYLTGYGTNMSLTLTTSNKYTGPHTINSIIIDYSRHSRKQ